MEWEDVSVLVVDYSGDLDKELDGRPLLHYSDNIRNMSALGLGLGLDCSAAAAADADPGIGLGFESESQIE